MRLLLINPRFTYRGRDTFPIGLGYIAAAARNFADLCIIDMNFDNLDKQLLSFRPDIIGITSTTPSAPSAMDAIRRCRELAPNVKIFWGGVHATFRPEDVLEYADIAVRGEGEITIQEIVQGKPLHEILGISYKDENGNIIHNKPRPLIKDIDSIPFPAHDLFDVKKYPIMSILTSRGCPHKCIYCCAAEFWQRRFRSRSIENVISEINFLYSSGMKRIRFQDSTFTLKRERVEEICNVLVERFPGISWSCEARADTLDRELLMLIAKSGCKRICIGIDSGSQEVLDKSGRGMQVTSIINAFRWAKEADLHTVAYVTFGLPGETEKSVNETINLLNEIKPRQTMLSLATCYPGTGFENGPYISMSEDWVSKFTGHGKGCNLFLAETLNRKSYRTLADKLWNKVKELNSLSK